MEITMAELALFAWAMVATLMWQQTKHDLRIHRMITMEPIKRIADGRLKVIDREDSFELKEVKQ